MLMRALSAKRPSSAGVSGRTAVDPGEDLAECRLPCAVLAEQRMDLSRFDDERKLVERAHVGKAFRNGPDLEPRFG
jgi:hypothetical protein